MKKNILKLALVGGVLLSNINAFASNIHNTTISAHDELKTETFKVYGNCGMCEKKIEGALKNIKGIEKADWNKKTKKMEVVFDEHQITLDEIKQKIADVGYDTDSHRATKETYERLPGCCQYERPNSK